MKYNRENKKKYMILQCRYYNGESNPPSSLPEGYAVIWNIEKEWLGLHLNEGNELQKLEFLSYEYHLVDNKNNDDETPESLMGLLFKHFTEPLGNIDKFIYEEFCPIARTFFDWYESVYLLWDTNQIKRANKRRKELIKKCKYYKGEDRNPWECCNFNIVLGFRRNFWEWEKAWVEQNANSYISLRHFPYLSDIPKDFFDRYKGPGNLYKHILNTHCGFLFHTSIYDFSEKNLRYFFEEFYLKMAPLGKGAPYYYSFYMGGDQNENPYKEAKEYPQTLYMNAWMSECKYHHEVYNTLEEFHLQAIARYHLGEIKQTEKKRWYDESELPFEYMALVFYFDQVIESMYRIDDSRHWDTYREGIQNMEPYLPSSIKNCSPYYSQSS